VRTEPESAEPNVSKKNLLFPKEVLHECLFGTRPESVIFKAAGRQKKILNPSW
jgi:hypothetical protein